jgi:hypothetical protein
MAAGALVDEGRFSSTVSANGGEFGFTIAFYFKVWVLDCKVG